MDRTHQSALIKTIQKLDAQRNELVDNPEIATRISAYEMAFRMQASVPELTDLSGESKKTLEMYGATPGDGSYASNCLLARRLVEKGTRFVQLYHRGWDHHGGLDKYMKSLLQATRTKRPGPSSPISSNADSCRTPSSSGEANSDAPPCSRAKAAPDAITISKASPCGWPEAA